MAAHSPSSGCLGASFGGSWLWAQRRHLASRILKRAFCLMEAGAPGESPDPPPGGGLSCRQGGGGAAGYTGGRRWDRSTGSWGWGASTASFLSPRGLKKVGVWTAGSNSSQGPPSQGSPVEEEREASRLLPHQHGRGTWLMLLGNGVRTEKRGKQRREAGFGITQVPQTADSFKEPTTAAGTEESYNRRYSDSHPVCVKCTQKPPYH